MYLKRLELGGFKSFAERTQLDLGPGVNVIVGPNGSGKSNIADALRWVLGEQSAKQLRGGKMEDVIFAGTAHRRPLGYAEIVMRLDNSNGAMPVDFKEITVTRRVYRSGESEYSLNGELCRLKDIQMLFMDTGVGRDGYSIIGQGRVDEILSVKSEDRRHVFEEAAGISKYKARRHEAFVKLEREKQNRLRVDDIISEMTDQLEPLFAQSEEAKRYLDLRDRYKNIHINIFLEEIQRIGIELEQTEKSLQNGMTESLDGKKLLTETRQAGEALKTRQAEADVKYRRANESLLEITTALEKKQSDAKLLESGFAQLETDIVRLRGEAEKREALKTEKSHEREQEAENKQAQQKELYELNNQLDEHIEQSAQREDVLREEAAALDAYNQAIMDAMNAVTDSRARVLEAETEYRRIEDDKEQLNIDIENHENTLEERKAACKQGEAALEARIEDLERAKRNEEAYANERSRLAEEARELEKNIRVKAESLTVLRGKYRALADLESAFEGYYRSVKAVLAKKASDPRFAGICGAVSELIGVEGKYETAVEIALGSAAQNIITETEDDAKLAIEMLKAGRDGRATFLPLTAVRGRNISTSRVEGEPGFVGVGAELVSCEAKYEQVMAQLLGDIIIVDTMENALAIHKKHRYSYKIVTLSGERLSPGGAITGGSINRQSAGIIGRGRQLAELKKEVDLSQEEVAKLTEEERLLNEKRQATRDALSQASEKASALRLDVDSLRAKHIQDEEALKALVLTSQKYNDENEKLMIRIVESNKAVRAAKTELAKQEEAQMKARAELEEYRRLIDESRREQTEEADSLTELKVEISRRTEWIKQAEQTIQRLLREEAVLSEEKNLLITEATAHEQSLINTDGDKAKTREDIERLQTRLAEVKNELSASETEKSALDTAITRAEADERTQADAAFLMEKELTRLEMRKEHLDAASHRLHNEIWEEYGLTHQSALAFKRTDMSETALRRESQKIKAELAEMNNVNVGAIEAYKQLKTRYDFLTAERDDILRAEAALDEIIKKLTEQMESLFAARFAEIDTHFRDVFREMFDGGKAGLKLLDEKNILESGIEITAQPPGKSLQNLMLLSGGERALTAIALLFAILRLKPSPFCVLDEIESALDDANITRFAKFIKTYIDGTQFIIITHRKGTMEAADYLYGVTMEEQGVSKLVSVKFVDGDETPR